MEQQKRKRGRPSTVSMIVGEEALRAADGNIWQVLKSKVRGATRKVGKRKSANNGGYIPISGEYADQEVFVIVLKEGAKVVP